MFMGKAIPHDYRKKIVRERQKGKTYPQIVEELGYPITVLGARKIYKAFEKEGEAGLLTGWSRSGRRPVYDQSVKDRVNELRRGTRGAPYIHSVLVSQGGATAVPSERTIQQWWRSAGTNRPKKGKTKTERQNDVKAHDIWEVDAKEQMPIQTGALTTWMNVADKGTGADLFAEVFPPEQGGRSGRSADATDF